MRQPDIPDFADFDDYRPNQRVAVIVRWIVLTIWLTLINYREPIGQKLIIIDSIGFTLAAMNAFVHWRILTGRRVTVRYAMALSSADLAAISAGIVVTNGFANRYFVLYYPALLGLGLAYPRARANFIAVTLVAGAYSAISVFTNQGLDYADREERILLLRISVMFAITAAGTLMARLEREKRVAAVEAERRQAARAMELQKKTLEAELAAQAERHRIATEIHDGIAQSMYALSLNLETAAEVAELEDSAVSDRLRKLVPIAKETLLETRHYIYDLKPLLEGEQDLVALARRQLKEFETVAGTPVRFTVEGDPPAVPAQAAADLYRILREALANILKHAMARNVLVEIKFVEGTTQLAVADDGVGFDPEDTLPGYGLQSMRERASRLGGTCRVISARGQGTRIQIELP